jgi:hypothetical protein
LQPISFFDHFVELRRSASSYQLLPSILTATRPR